MNPQPLSLVQRVVGGGAALTLGLCIMASGFGLTIAGAPVAAAGVETVAVAFGAAFFGVGLMLVCPATGRWRGVAGFGAVLVVTGFLAGLNLLAFGPGIRECTRSIGGVFGAATAVAGDTECRIAAGIASLYANGFAVILVLAGIVVANHHAPWTRPFDLMWKGIGLLMLAPVLAIVFVVMFLTGHGGDVKKGFASFFDKPSDPPQPPAGH